MATAGQQISYSATLPQKRVVTDRLIYIDPMETVALNALGLNNESSFGFVNGPGGPNQPYEWLEENRFDRADAINSGALTSDTTLTNLVVDNGTLFQLGDVLLIDAEYMLVTAISTNTLTVTRDFGGTQATHADDATVTIVGRARIEGTNSSDSNFTSPTSSTNAVSILHHEVDISRSAANLQRYGIPSLVNSEIDKGMLKLAKLLNLMVYHGQRKAGSASTPSMFGGLETFIATNINSLGSTPALTRKNIEDELQDCFDKGGNPDLILCNSFARRKINDFFAGSVRTERAESMGGIFIDSYQHPVTGGSLMIATDRDCPTDSLYILDRAYVGLVTIDPFFYEELGKVGDTAAFGQIVGEYSMVVASEAFHSGVLGFSTSA